MGVPPLRLLLPSAVLVVGVALVPAMGAHAEPEHAAVATAVSDRAVAPLTRSEAALDAAAQRVSDPDRRTVADPLREPPLWLLVLLVPILLGGAIGAGVALRRVG